MIALLIICPAVALDKSDPREKVLSASHLTRINDVDMKPWHLKVKFYLNDQQGQPTEQGIIEEWWAAPSTWKLRVESPSYTGTVIENKDGDFRTNRKGPIPLRIRAIENRIVYPMPMGEDLSKAVLQTSHHKLDNVSMDCIQLSEPPIPIPSAVFCFDQAGGALRAIISDDSSMLVRDHISQFGGYPPAFLIESRKGKMVTESAEVIDLSPIDPDDSMFTPKGSECGEDSPLSGVNYSFRSTTTIIPDSCWEFLLSFPCRDAVVAGGTGA